MELQDDQRADLLARYPELRHLPHDPDAEAGALLRKAVVDSALYVPADTVRSAIHMIRDDMERFDLQRFYETQGDNVELVDDDGMIIVATLDATDPLASPIVA